MSGPPPTPAKVVPAYPAELPITARRAELLAAIADHQVVIVAGETGSGKSTQLPKLCLELGRGARAGGHGPLIGHTQPRRLAARSVADRVASELGDDIGGTIGYAVRFTDRVGPDTRVKLMTDGILLNELGRDRDLRAYDTIIVDEAHERSLNIDFILGYLRQLLPRRPDLKVIVTSATIDTERFAAHFAGLDRADDTPAPIIEVSGRTHPVEIRHRPPGDDPTAKGADTVTAAADAAESLLREGMADVLVFASGEREIRDTADELTGRKLPNTEIVPLFARLSAAEQQRVFAPHTSRRVVIATNIAETSLTVPGVLSVVDPGTARISRYNKRTKVQRLPIEPVSQASADQRAGRCGRVAPGVCIRLYGEDDYLDRPKFTEPEILRTNLASVILQMTALGLGDVEAFPFVEAPDARTIADGVRLLEELGALEPDRPADDRRLTPTGKRLARLPLDPTLGRMLLEAERHGCVYEVMVIAAALSIQDVRERPTGQEQAAAELHARFRVPGSDFMGMVVLWGHLRERQTELSSSAFRRAVRREFLHYVRIREWQDVVTQLRRQIRSMKIPVNRDPADADAVHRALLAGLLANVGRLEENGDDRRGKGRGGDRRRRGPASYRGPRNATFSIGRGSVLSRSPSKWVMAAELVETNGLWTRTAATVQPSWIEAAAEHLVRRTYDSPTWNRDRGTAQVIERVQLRALTLVEGRTVDLARVDPALARELFILHTLVRDEWDTHHRFVEHNRAQIEEVRDRERRIRADLLVDEDTRFEFFDPRIPDDVTDVRRFDRWWRDVVVDQPHLLDLAVDDLIAGPGTADDESFPTSWGTADATGGDRVTLPIDYEFSPGAERDGVIFEIPVAVLNRTEPDRFDWLVPGLRTELIAALIKALPKAARRLLVPAPDRAAEVAATVGPDDGPPRPVVAAELSRLAGTEIQPSIWDDIELPSHLRPHFRVVDDDRVVGEGPDLAAIERRLRAHVRATVVADGPDLETDGLTGWTIGNLPPVVESHSGGLVIHGYPAVVDFGDRCSVRVLAAESEQRALHWNGIRRLVTLQLPRPARVVQGEVDSHRLLGLVAAPHGSVSAAVADAQDAVVDEFLLDAGALPFDEASFAALHRHVRDRYAVRLVATVEVLIDVVARAGRLTERLTAPAPEAWGPAFDDCTDQLAALVFDGMCVAIGRDRLDHLPRYLDGIEIRLDRLRDHVRADADRMVTIRRLQAEHAALVAERGLSAALDDIRWQIEELRVQQFAQALGTAHPVSSQRIRRALEHIRRS